MNFPSLIAWLHRPSLLRARLLTVTLTLCFVGRAYCQGGGYAGSLDAPESEVLKAVDRVVNDSVIHGTYSYEKDREITGAKAADSARIFGNLPEAGKAFFKVAENVLAPRHFKETADLGTVYVRYIVRGTSANVTALQVDAVYVEKNRRRQHASDGTVEQAEFDAIRDRLQKMEAEEKFFLPPKEKQTEADTNPAVGIGSAPASAEQPPLSLDELERKVGDLKHKVEMRTAAGGAALKAAPYRTAATLQPLPEKADLLIVVITKYWYGVETTDGRRGWVHRSQLEALP